MSQGGGGVCYQALEALKDGIMYSGKYEGGLCVFDTLHVVVFSNEGPKDGMLSEDRVNLIRLD